MKKHRIAIFASGSGTNAEAIIRHFQNNSETEIAIVLTNNPNAFVLDRAKKFNIPTNIFTKEQFRESDFVIQLLRKENITHVVLAGFLWLIPASLIKAFPNHIVNIHPSLLPKFSGKGMYGMNVHSAVKAANETETGITIHEVNEQYDEGRILFQARCPIDGVHTKEQIAELVHVLEYEHYPKVIEKWVKEN